MSRTVNADVVLAALDAILDGLEDRPVHPQVRTSNARLRLKRLMAEVEGQAMEGSPS